MSKTITIIGGQGNFGSKLTSKLRNCNDAELIVKPTKDTHHNGELVHEADVVVLTVRPQHVLPVLDDIRQVTPASAEVISFAAAVPTELMAQAFGRPVARAMMNPDATFGAFLVAKEEKSFFQNIFEEILEHPSLAVTDDQAIDSFTVAISYLYTTINWAYAHECSEQWLEAHLGHVASQLPANKKTLEKIAWQVKKQGNFKAHLKTKATKGGVTEVLIACLQDNQKIAPAELYRLGLMRIESILAAIT